MFKDSFRIERIYFEKLKSMIPLLQKMIANARTEEAKKLLENAVDSDGAILLLYRNLGEAWAELADLIEKLRKELDKQNETIQEYHDELNEKIDDVNNYIMQLIREIDQRLDAIEADLQNMNRVKFLDLIATESQEKQGRKTVRSVSYSLQLDGVTVDFTAVSRLVNFPHLVIVREATAGGVNYYYTKKADTTAGTGSISWHSVAITSGTTVTEKTVSISADDTVTVATVEREIIHYTAGSNITIDADNVISATNDVYLMRVNVTSDPDTGDYIYTPTITYDELAEIVKTKYILCELYFYYPPDPPYSEEFETYQYLLLLRYETGERFEFVDPSHVYDSFENEYQILVDYYNFNNDDTFTGYNQAYNLRKTAQKVTATLSNGTYTLGKTVAQLKETINVVIEIRTESGQDYTLEYEEVIKREEIKSGSTTTYRFITPYKTFESNNYNGYPNYTPTP